jgi:hypothetical protein
MAEWKNIPGYEGAYQASKQGDVRSVDRVLRAGPKGGTRLLRGQILKGKIVKGYRVVTLWSEQKAKTVAVHSLILLTFVGPRPKGLQGCHEDSDKLNCRLDNLRYDTVKRNHEDKVKAGRTARGASVNTAKLVEADVFAMREQRAAGAGVDELAAKYRVSNVAVSKICTGKNWKYAPGPITPSAPRKMK